MFKSIWREIENEFRNGTTVNKLLLVNCAVFAVFLLIYILDLITHPGGAIGWSNDTAHYFMIPSNLKSLLLRIWTPITSIFLHISFGHILFNMFALMIFGNIVGDLIGDKRVLPIYLLGGLVGNLFFFVYANVMEWAAGTPHFALGASGAIMALAAAAVTLSPNYLVRLILIGEVKVKYIVLVMVLLDFVGIANQNNTGGHFAHLGGLLYGWFFVRQLQFGEDPAELVNEWLDTIRTFFSKMSRGKSPFASRSKSPHVAYRNPYKPVRTAEGSAHSDSAEGKSHQEIVDAILDKIKEKGYESLSSDEKKYLFDASKKDK